MIDLDPAALAAAIAISEPLNIRAIAFDIGTFDPAPTSDRGAEQAFKQILGGVRRLWKASARCVTA
jgi:hypothetical protein